MNALDLIIKEKIAKAKELQLYEILGHFGDKLSPDVQQNLMQRAEVESTVVVKIRTKLGKMYNI